MNHRFMTVSMSATVEIHEAAVLVEELEVGVERDLAEGIRAAGDVAFRRRPRRSKSFSALASPTMGLREVDEVVAAVAAAPG